MSDTLLLDTVLWDLVLDASNNIAVASLPYAAAQDAASAIKVFDGELWYDTSQGVPYLTQILGQPLSASVFKASMTGAAMTVPAVVSATCYITGLSGRALKGQVQITDTNGTPSAASF